MGITKPLQHRSANKGQPCKIAHYVPCILFKKFNEYFYTNPYSLEYSE